MGDAKIIYSEICSSQKKMDIPYKPISLHSSAPTLHKPSVNHCLPPPPLAKSGSHFHFHLGQSNLRTFQDRSSHAFLRFCVMKRLPLIEHFCRMTVALRKSTCAVNCLSCGAELAAFFMEYHSYLKEHLTDIC